MFFVFFLISQVKGYFRERGLIIHRIKNQSAKLRNESAKICVPPYSPITAGGRLSGDAPQVSLGSGPISSSRVAPLRMSAWVM